MIEVLAGFESRMKFVAAVKAVINRKNKDLDIESQFLDGEMDNIIIMVMVYIMDYTLRFDVKCNLDNIEGFISEVLPRFNTKYTDYERLASYILQDILQNKGELRKYSIFDSKKNEFIEYTQRLIFENKHVYQLTDDAYDFLFRTKEIDSEIDFSVERFKLNEFIKRGNYTRALVQSEELVRRVREQKARLDLFLLRCHENITRISVYDYETTIRSTHTLMNEEYKELDDIRKSAVSRQEKVVSAIDKGVADEKAIKSNKEISIIIKNINTTIQEQRELINKNYSLNEKYRELLENSFNTHIEKRFDIEEEILKPIEMNKNITDSSNIGKLLTPLFRPKVKSIFSPLNYFLIQQKLRETAEEQEFIVYASEDLYDKKINIRNDRFLNIVSELFVFLKYCGGSARVSDFLSYLTVDKRSRLCEENSLLNVILKLYEIGTIDFDKWKNNKSNAVLIPGGEFDLYYCMECLSDNIDNIKYLRIMKLDNSTCEISISRDEKIQNVEISDFKFEVLYYEQ